MIKALDCLSTRQVATAENIANASTPNYRPLRTTFEQALKDAAVQGDDAVQAVTPKIEQAVAGDPGRRAAPRQGDGDGVGNVGPLRRAGFAPQPPDPDGLPRHHGEPVAMKAIQISLNRAGRGMEAPRDHLGKSRQRQRRQFERGRHVPVAESHLRTEDRFRGAARSQESQRRHRRRQAHRHRGSSASRRARRRRVSSTSPAIRRPMPTATCPIRRSIRRPR